MNQQHGGTVNTKRKPLSSLALALVAGLSVAAPQNGEAGAPVGGGLSGGGLGGLGVAAPQNGGAADRWTPVIPRPQGVAAPQNGGAADTPQKGGGSIRTTQGVDSDTGIAAPPKIGNDKAGFGSGSGMGSGGGAGSPSSLTGSMGSPASNSGGGSQTFGGGLPGTSPLSTPPAAGAGGAGGPLGP